MTDQHSVSAVPGSCLPLLESEEMHASLMHMMPSTISNLNVHFIILIIILQFRLPVSLSWIILVHYRVVKSYAIFANQI